MTYFLVLRRPGGPACFVQYSEGLPTQFRSITKARESITTKVLEAAGYPAATEVYVSKGAGGRNIPVRV